MIDDNSARSGSNNENRKELVTKLIEKLLELELKIEEQSDEIDKLRDELDTHKQ